MNRALLNTEVQAFIERNLETEIHSISLGKSAFPGISPAELAEQMDSKKRCEHKLPLWFNTPGIYYPPKLAVEQSSSETAARYKATLIEGDEIIDLTGGFGVDAHFFATRAKRVTHCEINQELSTISAANAEVLGSGVNYHLGDGMEYLRSTNKTYNTIYIDPSRRVESKKVFLLQDCEPNLVANLELLRSRTDLLMIKTAPLLDLQSTIGELKEVSSIHVISIKNECKEVLYLIRKEDAGAEPSVTCVLLNQEQIQSYTFSLAEERAYQIKEYSAPLDYIYEPDVALLKAGCFKLITRDFEMDKIHQNTHLYTSSYLNNSFPGRKFKLKQVWTYGAFQKAHPLQKANVICRNFPLTPQVLKKKLKISDGGDEYLLFCTGRNKELLVLNCERI